MKSPKLMILGIDGMSFRIVKRKLCKIKKFKKLLDSSQWGIFLSFNAPGENFPLTGPAWASIYTGKTPEEHGITTGGWLIGHKTIADVKTKTIWEAISEKYSLGMMTMPLTYPPFPIKNGWIVSGFPAPSDLDKIIYPPQIKQHLPSNFVVDYADGQKAVIWRENFNTKRQKQIVKMHTDTVKKIYKTYPVDVLAIGTTILDRYGHVYPQYDSKIFKKIYCSYKINKYGLIKIINPFMDFVETYFMKPSSEIIDAYTFIADWILDLYYHFNPEILFICSDHGMAKYGQEKNYLHDLYGFYLFRGKDFVPKIKTVSLFEFASIVCKVLNIPISKLNEQSQYNKSDKLTLSEKEEMTKQLKSLGYI